MDDNNTYIIKSGNGYLLSIKDKTSKMMGELMPKFRKKPAMVEAIQLTINNFNEIIAFCGDKIKSHPLTGVIIETPEGNTIANKNDWIIKDIKGEFYHCKPDVFDKTYERCLEIEGINA